MRGIYAAVCPDCDHEAHRHGLIEGEEVTGNYRCSVCGCVKRQSGPWIEMTRREFAAWTQAKATATGGTA